MADSLEKIFRALGIIDKQPDFSVADTLLAKLNGGMPQLDQFEAQSIGQILDYKNRYESAQKAYNTASRTFNDVNSTQAAKSQAQSDMAAAQHIMDEAHKGADFTRRVANNRGIDLSNYDAYNTSLDDANVNFVTKAQQDVSDLFAKDLTPDQFYDRTLRVLLSTGVHLNQAKAEAARRTRDYAIDREARFNTAMQMYGQNGNGALTDLGMQMYGQNGNGALTDLGMQMIGKFGKDSPELANLYANYAMPKEQWNNAQIAAREQAARNDAAAMAVFNTQNAVEQLNLKHLLNMIYGAKEQEYKQDNIRLTGEENRKTNKESQDNQFKNDVEKAKAVEEFKRLTKGASEQETFATALQFGFNPQEAFLLSKGQNPFNKNKAKDNSDKEEYQRAKDRYDRLSKEIENLDINDPRRADVETELQQATAILNNYQMPAIPLDGYLSNGNIPNDWDSQAKLIKIIRNDGEAKHMSDEQIAQVLYNFFINHGAAEQVAIKAANSVLPDGVYFQK